MTINALIFDFDGTLAELNIDFPEMKSRVRQAAREMGFTGPWPESGYLLEQVEAAARVLGNGFQVRAHRIIRSRELAAADQGKLFSFTRVLLSQARGQGLGVAIISRNCRDAILKVFPQVREEGRVFLPREAVSRPKPHPDHVLAACAALGLEPDRTAMVGDHPIDIESALAVGCLAIGVSSGSMTAEELWKAGAEIVLPDASRLLESLFSDRCSDQLSPARH